MESAILSEILKAGPWAALTIWLLWRDLKRETTNLASFKAGMESQRDMAANTASIERSVGSMQAAQRDMEKTLHAVLEELRRITR